MEPNQTSEVAPKKLSGQELAVMNTSNDALVTKVYSASLGYFKDDYSALFLKAKKKMLPIINRGTWARVSAVRQVVTRFLQTFGERGNVQILSLGAGFDITYFWLLDQIKAGSFLPELSERLTYLEVDYHDVVEKKIQTILKNESLYKHFWQRIEEIDPTQATKYELSIPHYKLFSADITNTEALGTKLNAFGVDPSVPTLVLSECVLIYLKPESIKSILGFLNGHFTSDLSVMCYEMINPGDAFGKMMLENLEDRGCRLQGIHDCPSEASQIARLKEHGGMTSAECFNMSVVYSRKLDAADRARIEKLEIFDEYEEWDLLSSHYCVSLGRRFANEEDNKKVII